MNKKHQVATLLFPKDRGDTAGEQTPTHYFPAAFYNLMCHRNVYSAVLVHTDNVLKITLKMGYFTSLKNHILAQDIKKKVIASFFYYTFPTFIGVWSVERANKQSK